MPKINIKKNLLTSAGTLTPFRWKGRGGEPIPHLSLIKTQNNDLSG